MTFPRWSAGRWRCFWHFACNGGCCLYASGVSVLSVKSSHTYALVNTQLNAHGQFLTDLWSQISVHLSLFQHCFLWTLDTLVFPRSSAPSPRLRDFSRPCFCSPPVPCYFETLSRQYAGTMVEIHFFFYSYCLQDEWIIVLHCLVFRVLKLLFHIFCPFGGCFICEGKYGHVIPYWPEIKCNTELSNWGDKEERQDLTKSEWTLLHKNGTA